MEYLEGVLKISSKGLGFVAVDTKSEAVEIDPAFLNTGLPGDLVRVALHPAVTGEARRTGEVVKIIQRKRLEFVGVLDKEGSFYYLVPDDKRVYKDILIAGDKLAGAAAGEKVMGRITEWRDSKKDPLGEVVTRIGRPGEHQTEMLAIVYDKGFQPGFSPTVEKEAVKIKANAGADFAREAPRRRDFRGAPTLTIDPADAKDFDDALSIKEAGSGKWEVGVHIADVAHYVKPGTALDDEAARRATSVYLVDRTIPMLPEILSNDLCSLKPDEDKLTFSAVFIFTSDFKLKEQWFGRTIIRSQKRFTYEEAQAALDRGRGPWSAELQFLNRLAEHLRSEKFSQGAIAFEQPEVKFVLDRAGRPLQVIKKERTASHLLVEDLMLLANRKVAEFVSQIVKDADKKFVYRIHDQPDVEKIKQLAEFIAPLGYRLPIGRGGVSSRSVNQLLRSVEGTSEETMVQTAAMRSMAKAVYSTKNIGHYGLAFTHYAHFTSPIRRYPDIMVHRLLDFYLRGQKPSADLLRRYDELTLHVSQMEQQAAEAERESIKYKQVEYMLDKTGKIFSGVISGLAKWGIYVQENETLAEGLIKLSELKDDFYIFDEAKYSMVGERTGRRWRLGDKVRVKVLRADLAERVIDFAFV